DPAEGGGLRGRRNPRSRRGDGGAGEWGGWIHSARPRRAGHHRPARRAKRRQRRLGGAGIAVGAWRVRRLRPTVIGMRRSAGNGGFFIVFVGRRGAWPAKRPRVPGLPTHRGGLVWGRRRVSPTTRCAVGD